MSFETENDTRFLNIDIDICARSGLDELLTCLGPSVLVLNRTKERASIELSKEYDSVDETAIAIVELIGSLPPYARNLWDYCDCRALNIGIQAGHSPHHVCFAISKTTVSSLAVVQLEIIFTVYSPLIPGADAP